MQNADFPHLYYIKFDFVLTVCSDRLFFLFFSFFFFIFLVFFGRSCLSPIAIIFIIRIVLENHHPPPTNGA